MPSDEAAISAMHAVGVWDVGAGVLWPLLLIGCGAALLAGSRLNRPED